MQTARERKSTFLMLNTWHHSPFKHHDGVRVPRVVVVVVVVDVLWVGVDVAMAVPDGQLVPQGAAQAHGGSRAAEKDQDSILKTKIRFSRRRFDSQDEDSILKTKIRFSRRFRSDLIRSLLYLTH